MRRGHGGADQRGCLERDDPGRLQHPDTQRPDLQRPDTQRPREDHDTGRCGVTSLTPYHFVTATAPEWFGLA